MRRRFPCFDAEGTTASALFMACHIAAFTLLGLTIYDDTAGSGTSGSAPDTPLTQPDPPPVPGAA